MLLLSWPIKKISHKTIFFHFMAPTNFLPFVLPRHFFSCFTALAWNAKQCCDINWIWILTIWNLAFGCYEKCPAARYVRSFFLFYDIQASNLCVHSIRKLRNCSIFRPTGSVLETGIQISATWMSNKAQHLLHSLFCPHSIRFPFVIFYFRTRKCTRSLPIPLIILLFYGFSLSFSFSWNTQTEEFDRLKNCRVTFGGSVLLNYLCCCCCEFLSFTLIVVR